MIDEKQTVSASYILNFYKEVQSLTHYHAQYLNFMLELENKYKDTNKAEDAEKEVIKNTLQSVRYQAHKCYIAYKSILTGLNQKPKKEILEYYSKIKDNFVINRDDIENLVIALNAFLVEDIVKKLLQSSQDLLTDIYEPKPKTE